MNRIALGIASLLTTLSIGTAAYAGGMAPNFSVAAPTKAQMTAITKQVKAASKAEIAKISKETGKKAYATVAFVPGDASSPMIGSGFYKAMVTVGVREKAPPMMKTRFVGMRERSYTVEGDSAKLQARKWSPVMQIAAK